MGITLLATRSTLGPPELRMVEEDCEGQKAHAWVRGDGRRVGWGRGGEVRGAAVSEIDRDRTARGRG